MDALIESLMVQTINENLKLLFENLEEKYGERCGFTSDTLFSDYKVTGLSKIRGYQRKFTVVKPIKTRP